MTNDATVEKTAEILKDNPAGILQYRDELPAFFAVWDRQGHEEDRGFYLEAWNGSGSKTVDRISRGTIHVPNLCVSLFGSIQPAKLMGYLRAANSYDNDGFVQRLQVAVYPDKPTWVYIDEQPDKIARDNAFDLIKKIAEASFSSIGYDADDYNRYTYTRFDPAAQQVFKEWLTNWEMNILPNESGLLLEHFTKYRSLMPSLAVVFHVCDCLSKATLSTNIKHLVTASAARMAVEWCAYLASHAKRIYGLLDTVSIEGAKTLLQRIKQRRLADGFKARDIARMGWSHLTTTADVEAALTELITRNYLREVEPTHPASSGRPEASSYLINPQIFQNT